MPASTRLSPVLFWSLAAVAAAALFCRQLIAGWPQGSGVERHLQQIILIYGTAPRAATALLAGATLGLSGLLLQRVLRNPLAEPSTLGVSAGAQLAMAVATIHAPALMAFSVGLVAFAGGLTAVTLVLALTWRRGLEPVSVVLAGMMTALTANAASAALILANGEYLFSLFIWGGGSLTQQSWGPALVLGFAFLAGLAAAALLLRPLALLGLDDAAARSLGVAVNASRFLVIGVAVWMATTVAAQVGIVGFIGLAAPALATLSGARSLKQRLVLAPLNGAILLWLTDGLVQVLAGSGGERVPTGAATALIGGPLLIWLLPRLKLFEWPSLAGGTTQVRRAARPILLLAILAALACLVFAMAAVLGRGPDGWTLATGQLLADLADLRIPRLVAAASAGAMLGVAGVVIQRITSNPLAGPEILGVGMGAGAGLAAVLLISATAGLGWQMGGSALGALVVLLSILALGARGGLGPERLLFAGIAANALCSAVLTAIIALGNQQSYTLLQWLSGSTGQVGTPGALTALAGLCILAPPLFLAARWLDLFPLGHAAAQALGLAVGRARFILIACAALLTALAALFVGPLSFIGLIAPHLARLIGLAKAWQQLCGALLIGAALMALSDWLARMAVFPYQLPIGLFAALLGGPYLITLLARGTERRG
ncbi:Fe(3+)-hydroxamate ABC transporter permease FhuB [Shinella sp. G-2]|uniref:Fe(3+)-hydroxamate ABC transporter permease FhuB n=1 Tax=Shinella sp. G-2 TaxID=3133141 RepID=UPI003D0768E8